MAEVELPSNSKATKQKDILDADNVQTKTTKEPIKPVTSKPATRQKRTMGSKMRESLIGSDARSVGEYIMMDVLIPSAKRVISEAVSQGVDRLLFGESRPRDSRHGAVYTSYSSSSPRRAPAPVSSQYGRQTNYRAQAQHDFSNIIIEDRLEAERVISSLSDIIEAYGVATVSDLYNLVEITPSYVDQKWGWTDIRGSDIRRIREGYLLILPRPVAI